MRILVVVHQFLPRNVAGTEVYTYRMAQELRRLGHEVRLFFGELDPARPQFETEQGEFEGIPFTRMITNFRIRRFADTYRCPVVEEAFLEEIDRFRPDVVHIQHLQAASVGLPYLAHLRGLPVIYTLHEYAVLCPAGGQLILPTLERCDGPGPVQCGRCIRHQPLADPEEAPVPSEQIPEWEAERRAEAHLEMARHVSTFVSPSRYLAEVFVSAGYPRERFLVMDNGFDVTPFANFRREPSRIVRFGYVGAMVPHKGVHTLVEAFNGLGGGEWELHVFGGVRSDSPHAQYQEEIRRLATDERIRIHGAFRLEEVARVYSGIDVLVVPSIWVENSPLTIHEAFVVGAPVLTSNIGGMAELVDDGVSGLHFEAGSVPSIRQAARRILEEQGLLDRLRSGIPRVKTIEEHGPELDHLYASVTAEPMSDRELGEGEAYLRALPERAREMREAVRALESDAAPRKEDPPAEPPESAATSAKRPWWKRWGHRRVGGDR